MTATQNTGGANPRIDLASAPGTVYAWIGQRLEAMDVTGLRGQKVTLSLKVYANNPHNLGFYLAKPSGGTDNWTGETTVQSFSGFSHNGDSTFQAVEATLATALSAADVLDGLMLHIDITDGLAAGSGDVVSITDVQLEVGEVATPFEQRSYAEELDLCQRYYWRGQLPGAGFGYKYGPTGVSLLGAGDVCYPVQMRVAPTLSIVTIPTYTNCSHTDLQGGTVGGFTHRVSVAPAGIFRVTGGVYSADAEL